MVYTRKACESLGLSITDQLLMMKFNVTGRAVPAIDPSVIKHVSCPSKQVEFTHRVPGQELACQQTSCCL